MRRRNLIVAMLLFCSAIACAEQSTEKWEKRVSMIEDAHAAGILKADRARVVAIQKVNSERARALTVALADAKKRLDADAPTIKALTESLARAEKDAKLSVKPEKTVAFGHHRYAIILDAVVWHTAKRRCEEMGGRLVIFNTPQEQAFVLDLCRKENCSAWVGATDEDVEGAWKWVDGSAAQFNSPHINNGQDVEHYMIFDLSLNDLNDVCSGRASFVCEWN